MKRFFILLTVVLIATTNICSAQNDIRFKDWGEKEWLDNGYIRELRNFFDAYSNGDIDDEQYEGLAPYKSLMKSKFAVLYIEPFPGGGTFIDIVFLDNPRIVFKSWVYSFISEKTVVDGYEVRHCERYDEEIDLTKEEILKIIEEKPLNKLW
ncbi:MAG: hypothetical protein J6U73_02795 [Alistipes sp.]|nr:hypothetical protein [Alistipes sp.]MBO7282318.1 hypothetical protein [Alistipes sp.]